MRPLLVLDAYLDERGGAHNLERLLAGLPLVALRTLREPLPRGARAFSGILVTGSAASVLDEPEWLAPARALLVDALGARVPVLGICFGHQLLAQAAFGPGSVRRAPQSELGWVEIERLGADPLLDALPERFPCFSSHLDEVVRGPVPMRVLARSERCDVQAFRVGGAPAWGVQFHPEMERAESDELVRAALARHPHLGDDVEPVLAAGAGAPELGSVLLRRFAQLARRADARAADPRPNLSESPPGPPPPTGPSPKPDPGIDTAPASG